MGKEINIHLTSKKKAPILIVGYIKLPIYKQQKNKASIDKDNSIKRSERQYRRKQNCEYQYYRSHC